MAINYDNPVQNLPDAYKKGEDSNNYKLLRINSDTDELLRTAVQNVFDVLNLNNAKGKALDEIYGSRLNLLRGNLSDEQYTIRLRAKIMQNMADGSFDKVVEALAYVLQCDKSSIHIVESETPNRVIIKDIHLTVLENAGFEPEEIIDLLNSLLAVNVKVETFAFTGTFEFGEDEYEYDETKGFADDDGTIGGYLGLYGG